ncbi:MAG TPA: ATP-binding protein [Polyangiaceae bacterium]
MGPSITIFWIDVGDGEASILDRVARAHHASLVPVKFYSLAALTYAALAQGAVVFVARSEEDATRALGMGVDEVVRIGEIREDTLEETLARAKARASARTAYQLKQGLFQDDDELALGALAAAFGNHLAAPLASAALECELLESALGGILDIGDDVVKHTIRQGTDEESRDLAIHRLALPPSQELKRLLSDVRTQVHKARATATTLQHLAARAEESGRAHVTRLIEEVVGVMQSDFSPYARIEVTADGPGEVSVASITVAFILSALLVNAVDAVRVARRDGGRIQVRLSEHEGAVVLEVEDNGRGIPADLRPSVFDPYFNLTRAHRTGLARVRDRMRRCGGDLMVDSDDGGTIVRVLFPTSDQDVLFEADQPARGVVKRGPPG